MRIGRMNKKIDIREQVTAQSTATGDPIVSWSTYLKQRWARVRPMNMRERFNAQQTQAMADTEFTIRYTTGIHPTMIVIYNGATYNIESIMPDEDECELQLLCSIQVT